MLSIEGLELGQNIGSLNFIGALALHQHKRDMALGLNHITTKTRGLLWYYNVKQRDLLIDVVKASFKLGTIRQAQRRMNEIMLEVQHAKSHDETVALLKEAKKLKRTIKRLNSG